MVVYVKLALELGFTTSLDRKHFEVGASSGASGNFAGFLCSEQRDWTGLELRITLQASIV